MITGRRIFVGISLSLATAGCGTSGNIPLVFVQTETLGITANATGSQATPELTLGYRDIDVALVPVVNGGSQLKATETVTGGTQAGTYDDALSVIGQFNAGATAATSPTANLGKFFATGQAAKKLADGFSKQLGSNPAKPPQQ
jgi:hypothetical protein